MSIVLGILTFALIVLSLFLVLIVLAQKAKSDGGVGAAMGGGMTEAAFGADTGNVLSKATIYAAVAFFVINDDNSSAIFQYVEAGGAGITSGELTLMGTIDAKIVTGDLAFA